MPVTVTPALPADSVVDFLGVNVHGTGVEYTATSSVMAALAFVGIRHVRMGRVNVGQAGQQNIAVGCASAGIGVMAIIDDFAAATPASRMAEVASNWGGVTVDYWENPNEPQNGFANPASWPQTVGTNGPNSSDLDLGIDEVNRQLALIKSTVGVGRPILGPSMSMRNITGWYNVLGDITASVDGGSCHSYQGGQPPNQGTLPLSQNASEATAMYGSKPLILSETGGHDFIATVGTHKPTSVAAMAAYAGRMPFEAATAGFSKAYFYELVDESAKTSPDQEGHFGMFDSSWNPKPYANALRNLTTLYSDAAAGTFTPASLPVQVSGAGDTTWTLHARKNRTHLLSLWSPTASIWNPNTLLDTTFTPLSVTITLGFTAKITVRRPSGVDSPPVRTNSITIGLGADLTVLEIEPPAPTVHAMRRF